MGSSRRGGAGAVFGDPFAMGAGGACRDHVGMVNWGPGGRSGGATGVLIPSVRRAVPEAEFGRATRCGAKWVPPFRRGGEIHGAMKIFILRILQVGFRRRVELAP